MANWDKLNAEFDALLDKMTDEDWTSWEQSRAQKKEARRAELITRTGMHKREMIEIVASAFNSRLSSLGVFRIPPDSGEYCVPEPLANEKSFNNPDLIGVIFLPNLEK